EILRKQPVIGIELPGRATEDVGALDRRNDVDDGERIVCAPLGARNRYRYGRHATGGERWIQQRPSHADVRGKGFVVDVGYSFIGSKTGSGKRPIARVQHIVFLIVGDDENVETVDRRIAVARGDGGLRSIPASVLCLGTVNR